MTFTEQKKRKCFVMVSLVIELFCLFEVVLYRVFFFCGNTRLGKHILDGKAKNGAFRKFDRDIVALSQDLFDDGDVIVISSVAFENQIRAEIEQTCPDKRLFIIGLHR